MNGKTVNKYLNNVNVIIKIKQKNKCVGMKQLKKDAAQ
jgi:hypothetical protein